MYMYDNIRMVKIVFASVIIGVFSSSAVKVHNSHLLKFVLLSQNVPVNALTSKTKAKVVASIWGAEFVQFFAALPVLPWSIWKERLEFILFFQIDRGKRL